MSVSAWLWWPDGDEEILQSSPGFWNDDDGIVSFVAYAQGDAQIRELLEERRCLPIIECFVGDDATRCISADEVFDACERLSRALSDEDESLNFLVSLYSMRSIDPKKARSELIQDLSDLGEIAQFAKRYGPGMFVLQVGA